MPPGWNISLKNDNFDVILRESRSKAGKIVHKTGRNAITYIKEAIVETGSVDTHKMHDSVEEADIDKPFLFAINIGVGYWEYTNDGTHRIPARFWLEEGMNRAIAEFNMLMDELGRRVK